jgi:hypothetical protein
MSISVKGETALDARLFRWRFILPVLQIAIAFAAIVYAPYEYKSRPHPVFDDTYLLGWRRTWPPPILRVSYAINFPAHTGTVAVSKIPFDWDTPVIHRENHPFIWLSVQDCTFLLAVGALWYWLGSIIDRHSVRVASQRSKVLALVKWTIGCFCTLAVAALAILYVSLTNSDLPLREIGFFGLVWAVILAWYFGSNLTTILRTH